ncbi:maleylpyruvate isomerase family mycothiol-dependent enzyme [Rhizohabitans arisaemae]|uniref:maleylpyruvate isomerase family mycothiol-dependent enzyme n=1 Tax=Rhizohabitans arisaemae TaxID=2720610 RepID=UPI0024B0C676|nr:maleylpyruvate isomerase family mycothiol-dependent enzyme [Rhizohabitans arisaemae]
MAVDINDPLKGLDPFDIHDAEAARIDRFLGTLNEAAWDSPSRCTDWSVRDVLAHLAGEEIYNHAVLDDDLEGFIAMLQREGVGEDLQEFNEWCVRRMRGLPVAEVLDEWRTMNGETRRRMRELGADGIVQTSAGPYPVGLQTFHYASEYAIHADDIGVPISEEEAADRTMWRAKLALFVLAERESDAQVEITEGQTWVRAHCQSAQLSTLAFVEATAGRLPEDYPLDVKIKAAVRCFA